MALVKPKAKAKPKAKKPGDWFNQMSKPQQQAYIAKHPTSKYAKGTHLYTKKGQANRARTDKIKAELTTLSKEYSSAQDAYEAANDTVSAARAHKMEPSVIQGYQKAAAAALKKCEALATKIQAGREKLGLTNKIF